MPYGYAHWAKEYIVAATNSTLYCTFIYSSMLLYVSYAPIIIFEGIHRTVVVNDANSREGAFLGLIGQWHTWPDQAN
jgi:hypothetical protein